MTDEQQQAADVETLREFTVPFRDALAVAGVRLAGGATVPISADQIAALTRILARLEEPSVPLASVLASYCTPTGWRVFMQLLTVFAPADACNETSFSYHPIQCACHGLGIKPGPLADSVRSRLEGR